MATVPTQIRIDEDVKKRAVELFATVLVGGVNNVDLRRQTRLV